MIRESFNDGWTVATRGSMFEAMQAPQWTNIDLPHDAMQMRGRSADGNPHLGYFHDGAWQYRKSFDVPAEWASRRVTLEFEGVYRDAMVFVNDAFAGQWAFGYSAFHVPLDPFLKYGTTNVIRVEAQTHHDSRWYSGAGIYRPVHLLVGDLVHVTPTGLRVTTPEVDPELAVITAATDVVNEGTATRTLTALLEVRDDSDAVVARETAPLTILAGETLTVRHRAYVSAPELWSVGTPRLYTATVSLRDGDSDVDQAATRFGIRTLSLDPHRGLRINGERVKLRGASLHHDNGVIGAAEFDDAAERRIRILKAAGFNAVRSAAKPASRALLDACDRLGMLVIDETFDMWMKSKTVDDYSRRFADWWQRDVDALVAKAFNHPSVIMYTIGNEIIEIGTPHGARAGRLLAERIRSQDPSRFVTNALNCMMTLWGDPVVTGATDPAPDEAASATDDAEPVDSGLGFNGALAQVFEQVMAMPAISERIEEAAAQLDLLGYNYGDVRYEIDKAEHPTRILFGSETFPSRIAHNWRLALEHDHVIGDFTWVGWDYLGEPGVGRAVYPGDPSDFTAPYPWLTGSCSDIDLIGQRMPVSHYREAVFGLTSTPYLAVQRPEHADHPFRPTAWSWSDTVATWSWPIRKGTQVRVEAYVDADEVAYLLNGVEVARAVVGEELPLMAVAEVPYEDGVLQAVAYTGGAESGRSELRSAGAVARIALARSVDEIAPDSQRLAYIDIELRDEHGVVQTVDDRRLEVRIDGPATLAGLGTARQSTLEPFGRNECTTYQGRALAVVRYTASAGNERADAGTVTVTVTAEGGLSATTEFTVRPVA